MPKASPELEKLWISPHGLVVNIHLTVESVFGAFFITGAWDRFPPSESISAVLKALLPEIIKTA